MDTKGDLVAALASHEHLSSLISQGNPNLVGKVTFEDKGSIFPLAGSSSRTTQWNESKSLPFYLGGEPSAVDNHVFLF
jgi:hypothetical protein